jgi:AraC-like DNA-binding protein
MREFSEIIGIHVQLSRIRRNFRTYYFSKKEREGNRGCTLFLIDSGKASFDFGSTRIIGAKGDIICWDEGALAETCVVPGHTLSYHGIVFDILSKKPDKMRLSDLGLPFLIKVKNPRTIRSILDEIHRTFTGRASYRLQECSALGLRLFLALEEGRLFGKSRPLPIEKEMNHRIRETLFYINRNYKKQLDVPTLARRAGLHPVYYARLFRKQMGVSPYRYVLEYKISKAKDYLLNYTPERLYISTELGFRDYSHFYRTFRKVTRLTPTQFIQKHR